MKITLFVLSCFVAVTWQQQNFNYWSPYRPFAPQFFNGYNYPADPYYSRYFYPNHYQQQPQLHEQDTQALLAQMAIAHQKLQADYNKKPADNTASNQEPVAEGRVPGGLIFRKPADNDIADARANNIRATFVSYQIVTTTITFTSAFSCLPLASFYGGSTQACRRKREDEKIRAMIEAETKGDYVKPSPVESVEPTVSPAALEASKAPNVDSSLIENNADESGHRAPRLGNVYATTVTSTLTSFRVITSLSKKTVLIGSNLSCMPSGFNVC